MKITLTGSGDTGSTFAKQIAKAAHTTHTLVIAGRKAGLSLRFFRPT